MKKLLGWVGSGSGCFDKGKGFKPYDYFDEIE